MAWVGIEYRFDWIDPGAKVAVRIWGYQNNEAVAYSAVVYALAGGTAYTPAGIINMIQERVDRDPWNQSIARTIRVENLAYFNPIEVDILVIDETF